MSSTTPTKNDMSSTAPPTTQTIPPRQMPVRITKATYTPGNPTRNLPPTLEPHSHYDSFVPMNPSTTYGQIVRSLLEDSERNATNPKVVRRLEKRERATAEALQAGRIIVEDIEEHDRFDVWSLGIHDTETGKFWLLWPKERWEEEGGLRDMLLSEGQAEQQRAEAGEGRERGKYRFFGCKCGVYPMYDMTMEESLRRQHAPRGEELEWHGRRLGMVLEREREGRKVDVLKYVGWVCGVM